MIDWSKVRPSDFIEPRFYVEITFRKRGVVESGDAVPQAMLDMLLGLYDPDSCYDATVTCTGDGYPTISYWCSLAEDAESSCATTLFYLKDYGYEPV